MTFFRHWQLRSSFARTALGVASVVLAGQAQASDFSGVVTMMFGVPGLLLLNAALAVLFIAEPGKGLRWTVGLIGVPPLTVGFLLWGDAASLFRTDDTKLVGIAYFLLYAVAVALVARHFLRRPALAEGGGGN